MLTNKQRMRLEAKVGRKVQLFHWKKDALEKITAEAGAVPVRLNKSRGDHKWMQKSGKEQGAEQDPVIAGYPCILEYALPSSKSYCPRRDN